MSQIEPLLQTLKRELKARGITYEQVAQALGLSESSVKRLFSQSRLSLQRLESLCHVLDMEISDLVQKMHSERQHITCLSETQEKEIAADPALLLVAISVLNHWSFEQIVATYAISEAQCTQLLVRLDRLELIELLPLNRIRLTVASDFRWIANGPIQNYFAREVQPEFLQSGFSGPGEKLVFRSGMLSRGSNAALLKKIDRLVAEFTELHVEDASLPLEERFGSSILVATRPWEFSYFEKLRRNASAKRF